MHTIKFIIILLLTSSLLSACTRLASQNSAVSATHPQDTNTDNQKQAAIPHFTDREHILADLGKQSALEFEVVNTPASVTLGLSGRDQIGADGMLFVYDRPRRLTFWMKEMKFNLDLIWILHGKIVEITPNVPAPAATTPLNELPTYMPHQPVDMVLEVEAGKAKLWQLQVGQRIIFSKV